MIERTRSDLSSPLPPLANRSEGLPARHDPHLEFPNFLPDELRRASLCRRADPIAQTGAPHRRVDEDHNSVLAAAQYLLRGKPPSRAIEPVDAPLSAENERARAFSSPSLGLARPRISAIVSGLWITFGRLRIASQKRAEPLVSRWVFLHSLDHCKRQTHRKVGTQSHRSTAKRL